MPSYSKATPDSTNPANNSNQEALPVHLPMMVTIYWLPLGLYFIWIQQSCEEEMLSSVYACVITFKTCRNNTATPTCSEQISLALAAYPFYYFFHLSMGDTWQSEQMRHIAEYFASTLDQLRKRTNNTSDPQYCALPRLRHPVSWPPSSTVPVSSPWVC